MTWKTRHHRRYLYRSVRVGDRVRTVYLGNGARAAEALRQAEAQRRRILAEQEALAAARIEMEPLDRLMQDIGDRLDLLTQATLVLRGFWNRHGTWRRPRERTENQIPAV